jgi:PAS domain S-box-containing protein
VVTLVVAAVAVAVAFSMLPDRPRARATAADLASLVVFSVAAAVAFVALRRRGAWHGGRPFAVGLVMLAATSAIFLAQDLAHAHLFRPSYLDLLFLLFLAAVLAPVRSELVEHFRVEDRREISGDSLLVSVALTCVGYVFMRPGGADDVTAVSAAVFSLLAAVQLTFYGALALWAPTAWHTAQFAVFALLAGATYAFGWEWVHGTYDRAPASVDLALAVGALGIAAIVAFRPADAVKPIEPARLARPILTSLSVFTACAGLGVVAFLEDTRMIREGETTVLIALLALGVGFRILANQLRSSAANARARRALEQKEAALAEADAALDRVREANETLRESEEHLRLVFETAADGFVELDDRDVVVRANEAFCLMVGLPRDAVEGQPWTAIAASVPGSDAAFASLPATGQGTIRREGQPLYVESRASVIPMNPARKLLLVRDVTAGRVADQTIRSLFQFLQDRDEDRTRILRRTNAAIESERNRIARDLHDGPVQGVSAASLSLEAALLMIKAGEIDRGLEVLNKIRRELSGEADALRRLMAGLRPPLLEERGLIPALRETLVRFGEDFDLIAEFDPGQMREVPDDLETLAYRIVQEALSNVGKHARAEKVSVQVETQGSQLRIEVVDDGIGFEPSMSREFLRQGRVGLASMRERVELANGTFVVHSIPKRGTQIIATLPLDVAPARELAASDR